MQPRARRVYHADGHWCLRDLNSLNGTRINSEPLDKRMGTDAPTMKISVGHTRLLFVGTDGPVARCAGAPVRRRGHGHQETPAAHAVLDRRCRP